MYHCGSDSGWSDIFYFTALKEGVGWSPRFALFGDLGNDNPQSLARLQKDTQIRMYDAILHIGKTPATCRVGLRLASDTGSVLLTPYSFTVWTLR